MPFWALDTKDALVDSFSYSIAGRVLGVVCVVWRP